MDGISTNDLFVKAIMGSVPKIFLQLWFACNMYILNLVTLDYMLLIIVYVVYHDTFVGGVVVFDQVGQHSEFAVGQHLFCIFY